MRIGIEILQLRMGSSGGLVLLLRDLLTTAFSANPDDKFYVYATGANKALLAGDWQNVEIFELREETYFQDLDQRAQEDGLDVLVRSYPLATPVAFSDARQLVMIPDLQHEDYPEFFAPPVLKDRRRAFDLALAKAGGILTISDFSRSTILRHPSYGGGEVFVTRPALRKDIDSTLQVGEPPAGIPSSFFFYPANAWPHKNHARLLEAYGNYRRNGGSCGLVLTGDPLEAWSQLRKRYPQDGVKHLGYVSASELQALYERATALLFLSQYEGFGIPLLEAFLYRLPVVCSNTTSLPETAGDAALLCDPEDVDAIAGSMRRVETDELLRSSLVVNGAERLRAFSWDSSAVELIRACEHVSAGQEAKEPTASVDSQPLVSIVTPSLNQGRFIRATIDSVLSQTYPRIEYVVIDGGSVDDTLDVLGSYDGALKWMSEPDRGQGHAINKGLRATNGEIVAYLNSDDVLEPDAVARIVDYFRAHPVTDLVYGRAHYIDEEGVHQGRYKTAPYSFQRLMQDCCICQPATFWRRSLVEHVGEFDEDLHLAMDYEYWLRVDRKGGVIDHVEDVLASSRMYPENKTLRARSSVYEEVFTVCRKWGGYVHLNYYLGLWHYRLCERKPWRLIPARLGFWKLTGRIHFAADTVADRHAGQFRRVFDFLRILSGGGQELPGLQNWSAGSPEESVRS